MNLHALKKAPGERNTRAHLNDEQIQTKNDDDSMSDCVMHVVNHSAATESSIQNGSDQL